MFVVYLMVCLLVWALIKLTRGFDFTGDDVPLSPFCRTNVEEWDEFRSVDMDKQVFIKCFLNI